MQQSRAAWSAWSWTMWPWCAQTRSSPPGTVLLLAWPLHLHLASGADMGVHCSDPLEASLVDGLCVQRWCSAALEQLSRTASAACSAALAPAGVSQEHELRKLAGRAASLVTVLEVLEGQYSSADGCTPHWPTAKLPM